MSVGKDYRMVKQVVTVKNPTGLHLRPAGVLGAKKRLNLRAK